MGPQGHEIVGLLQQEDKEALDVAGVEMPDRQVDVWLRQQATAP